MSGAGGAGLNPGAPAPAGGLAGNSFRATHLGRATVLLIVAMFALRSGHLAFAAVIACLVAGSALLRRGLSINRSTQVVLVVLALALSWPLTLALNPEGAGLVQTLTNIGTVLCLVSLAMSVPRLWMAAPGRGESGTAAANLLAVLGLSQGVSGPLYPAFVGLWAVLQLAALRAEDPARPALAALSRRHRLVLVLMAGLAAATGASLALGIPPAQRWAMRKFYYTFARSQSGFSTRMELGSLSGLADSNRLVLRVYGPKPDHLRGYVFRRYAGGGRWLGSRQGRLLEVSLPRAVEGEGPGGLTRVVTVAGDATRYFLPLGADKVRIDRQSARVDVVGVLSAPPGEKVEQVQFARGPRNRLSVAPPNAEDLQVPPPLRAELRRIARRWTQGAKTDQARLDALRRHLRRHFAYALSFQRAPRRDPVLDFLTRQQKGHCEYFAAGMALLARSLNIPARVVAGYRVGEYNPLGEHHVVRERDAHSWVEAWVPQKGWQTHDPTPGGAPALEQDRQMPTAAALWDLLASWLNAAGRRVKQLTALSVSLAVGALVGVWLLIRLVRRLRGRSAATRRPALSYGAPLPALEQLLAALGSRGQAPRPGEPLEAYARRLSQQPDLGPHAEAAARALSAYAAWRYGARGDPETVSQALEELAQQLRAPG